MIRNYLIVALGTSRLRKLVVLSALLPLALAITGLAQPAEIVMFDEDDLVGADYREASYGFARDGDLLMLLGPSQDKMPVELNRAYSGASSGLLNWQHVRGGYWEMNVEPEDNEPYDLTGFDTLIVFINGPDSISGTELPRVALRDIGGTPSPLLTLSKPENVRVNFRDTGFSDTSSTTIVLTPIYRDALPTDQRRPGYPDDLRITFSDVPLDTSIAAIGAPSTPAHFKVEATASQLQLEFSFRDLDGDRTLSSVGEFIDVRMPETEGAARTVPTWRIEVTSAPEPLSPPGNGDVYHLVLLWDEFALDSDPETWQRVALPLRDALSDPTWNATQVWLPMFIHGGPNDIPKTMWFDRISVIRNDDIAFIDEYQRLAFDYFWIEANPQNGLVKDRSRATSSVSSIAAVGFGLSAYTVGVDRGWITREQAVERTLNTLRFFWNAPQSTAADATGYKGFFYHFLNMSTGRRAGTNELSTIDTALLLAGILHSREYYDRPDAGEEEIRALADSIYERVDWQWAQPRPPAVSLGWHPDSGFIGFDWIGYNEAMILYILALGSPTHPVDPSAWAAWTSRYDSDWQTHYGITFLTFPPLFGHQYSHVWIDFRGIADSFMRSKGIDYFENSRRATLAQRLYHGANPRGWPNYSLDEWGLTASDIPSGYRARGAPPAQNDEGTLAPTAPGGSIAFTPEESIAALRTMRRKYPNLWGPYGLRDAYNVAEGWFDVDYLGIDQGPILLMAENYRTERVWDVFMQNEAVQRGLERAGFEPVDTSIEGEIPRSGISLDNYPNPFSESTQVTFEIPAPGPVRLVVYDLLGREVKVLLDAFRSAGKHSLTMNGSLLAAGVYFYRLETSKGPQTGKMILIR